MKIRNGTRSAFVAQLTHAEVCEASGQCSCVRVGDRTVPDSVTWQAGETRSVHASVANLPEVHRALRRGELVVIPDQAERASSGSKRSRK